MPDSDPSNIRPLESTLTPENAYIFRIVHIDNMQKILEHGMQCRRQLKNYVEIGDQNLIENRSKKTVPCYPHGTLSDYVPFYFTPITPMFLNIKRGERGVPKRANEEIVILFSSLSKISDNDLKFVFTDRSAFRESARFSSDINDLNEYVPWKDLKSRNFRRQDNEDGFQRYQAEALVHGTVPIKAFRAFITFNKSAAHKVKILSQESSKKIDVVERPNWYPDE